MRAYERVGERGREKEVIKVRDTGRKNRET